jgi:DNA-binding NarL/FixJ family response regulator
MQGHATMSDDGDETESTAKRQDPLRVLLADGRQGERERMRLVLAQEPGVVVVGEADDGETAVRLALELAPDLLILDYAIPGFDGVELLRRVRLELPTLRVLLVTRSLHADAVRSAFACDAEAYVLEYSGSGELLAALRALRRGGEYVGQEIAAAFDAAPAALPAEPLLPRESRILECIAAGDGDREIAETLFVSLATVRRHRENLMRKLDLHNAAELTAFAIKRGLVPTH